MKRLRAAIHYLAPLLLILLAAVQIYRAHVYQQSPWKGGGFGMFSTVDSPGARYVRVFVLTEDGHDLEVPLPRRAAGTVARLKVIPQREPLTHVADAILQARWVWADYDPLRRLTGEDVDSSLRDLPAELAAPPAAPEPDGGAAAQPVRPVDQPRLRPLEGGEPDPPPEAFVPVVAARVELWRMTYDGESDVLRTRRMFEVTRSATADDEPGGADDA